MKFRSKFEKAVYEARFGKLDYEPPDSYLSYSVPSRYIPDWRLPNGILVESKGYFDPRARGKMLRVRKAHPDVDLRIVFQRASNRIGKSKRSLTYGEWATKNGFKWAEGIIPEEWWKE